MWCLCLHPCPSASVPGNFEQLGNVRKRELYDAAKVLRLKDEHITLMNSTLLADDPNLNWKTELVAKQIRKEVESLDIEAIITFDRDGVSYHPNHCTIYYAAASLCLAGYLPKSKNLRRIDSMWSLANWPVFAYDFVFRLQNSHAGLGECVTEVHVSVWSRYKFVIVDQLVYFELDKCKYSSEGDGRASVADAVVSQIVHNIFAVHGDKHVASNRCIGHRIRYAN